MKKVFDFINILFLLIMFIPVMVSCILTFVLLIVTFIFDRKMTTILLEEYGKIFTNINNRFKVGLEGTKDNV